MDWCTGRFDITKMILKTAANNVPITRNLQVPVLFILRNSLILIIKGVSKLERNTNFYCLKCFCLNQVISQSEGALLSKYRMRLRMKSKMLNE